MRYVVRGMIERLNGFNNTICGMSNISFYDFVRLNGNLIRWIRDLENFNEEETKVKIKNRNIYALKKSIMEE